MEKRLLELERMVWELRVRLVVLEGRHGIKHTGTLPELPEQAARDRLQEWADSLG